MRSVALSFALVVATLPAQVLGAIQSTKDIETENCGKEVHLNELHQAIQEKDYPKVYRDLMLGTDPWVVSSSGLSALMKAVICQDKQVISRILSDQSAWQPFACWVRNRADGINTVDEHGRTALILAVESGFFEGVEALISPGDADLLLRDSSKMTALDYAIKNSDYDCSTLLIDPI